MSKISEKLRYVGVNDLKKTAFEGMWPLPYGVSYNSYLILDRKTALIDTAEADFATEYMDNIRKELGDRKVDYLIVNHMEPDHSSLMKVIRETWPEVTIVANAKTVPMIKGYYGICDNVHIVKEGDSISLGASSLTFHMTPMVHWPETMMTYFDEEKTLFSGDAFGTFGALEGGVTDSVVRLHGSDVPTGNAFHAFADEMRRYYSNIVGKYGVPVQNAMKKLSGLPVRRICSTHGPVWETRIQEVVSLYDRLSRYEGERGVCIVYASMYGNTAEAARALEAELIRRGVPYAIHDAARENLSYAYRDAFRFDTLAVGSPTYNNEIFPPVASFMNGIVSRGLKNRKFAAFGSYTWMGGSVRQLNEKAQNLGFELLSDGLAFAQGYAPGKCDMSSLADAVLKD